MPVLSFCREILTWLKLPVFGGHSLICFFKIKETDGYTCTFCRKIKLMLLVFIYYIFLLSFIFCSTKLCECKISTGKHCSRYYICSS